MQPKYQTELGKWRTAGSPRGPPGPTGFSPLAAVARKKKKKLKKLPGAHFKNIPVSNAAT
jgi:hypothetical protein